jgi:hypothetical protein
MQKDAQEMLTSSNVSMTQKFHRFDTGVRLNCHGKRVASNG